MKSESWKFNGESVLDHKGNNVCTKVNGPLIAAAPELLSACREAQDWIYQAGLHGYDAYSANHIIAKLANLVYQTTQAHHGSEVCK